MPQSLLKMAKDLVMAQIEAHSLLPDDMHPFLQQTYASLQALKMQEDAHGSVAVAPPETLPAPGNWKKSITKHTVMCLECRARRNENLFASYRKLHLHSLHFLRRECLASSGGSRLLQAPRGVALPPGVCSVSLMAL